MGLPACEKQIITITNLGYRPYVIDIISQCLLAIYPDRNHPFLRSFTQHCHISIFQTQVIHRAICQFRFSRADAEYVIRQGFVTADVIECIIVLPSNYFTAMRYQLV